MAILKPVHNIGFKVGVVDCDVFCVINSFEHNYGFEDKVKVFLNVGAKINSNVNC